MKVVCDKDIVCVLWFLLMVMPRANFAGLRLETSHLDLRNALKDFILLGDKVAAKMLSTWTEKIMVLEGED